MIERIGTKQSGLAAAHEKPTPAKDQASSDFSWVRRTPSCRSATRVGKRAFRILVRLVAGTSLLNVGGSFLPHFVQNGGIPAPGDAPFLFSQPARSAQNGEGWGEDHPRDSRMRLSSTSTMAPIDGDFVVFVVGKRFNKPRKSTNVADVDGPLSQRLFRLAQPELAQRCSMLAKLRSLLNVMRATERRHRPAWWSLIAMTPERMWGLARDLPRPGRGGRDGLQRHARHWSYRQASA
jgi:hypothetical protein